MLRLNLLSTVTGILEYFRIALHHGCLSCRDRKRLLSVNQYFIDTICQ
jgi:hypothetical protein